MEEGSPGGDIDISQPLRSAKAILFTVTLVAAAGNMALQSVMPTIGRAFALSDTVVAGAFSVSALLWVLSSPFWARLSDRIGRKPVLMMGLAGFTLSMIATGIAAHAGLALWCAPALAFSLMVAGRSAHGVFGSGAPSASQAYLADRTADTARTSAISLLASAQSLGAVVGPAVVPFLILPTMGLAGPIYGFAAAGVLVLGLVWWLLPEDVHAAKPRSQPRKTAARSRLWWDDRVRDFFIYGFLLLTVQASNLSVVGFDIIDEMRRVGAGSAEVQVFIGGAMLSGAVATLLVQWGIIPLLKLQPRILLRYGAAVTMGGNLISLVASDYLGILVGYAISAMGLGLARPGWLAGSSLAVDDEEQGDIAGLMVSLAGLSFLGAPLASVALYSLNPQAPFLVNLIILGGALALLRRSGALRCQREMLLPA